MSVNSFSRVLSQIRACVCVVINYFVLLGIESSYISRIFLSESRDSRVESLSGSIILISGMEQDSLRYLAQHTEHGLLV